MNKKSTPARGDIRTITAPGVKKRLCLVLETDPEQGYADVALIHTYPEFATSADKVIAARLGRTPHTVVIQTDLRCAVWVTQLGFLVGHLNKQTFEALNYKNPKIVTKKGIWSGTPMLGKNDKRWRHKETEGQTMRDLSYQCARHLTKTPNRKQKR